MKNLKSLGTYAALGALALVANATPCTYIQGDMAFLYECQENGLYESKQCVNDNCFCVHPKLGYRMNSEDGQTECPSLCEVLEGNHASSNVEDSLFTPNCNRFTGNFLPMQCSDENENDCFCVNTETGDKLEDVYDCFDMENPHKCDIICASITGSNIPSVCDNDGNVYADKCEFDRYSCIYKYTKPLQQVDCEDILKEPELSDECNFFCTENFDPVCDTESNVYSNLCEFKRVACLQKSVKALVLAPCDFENNNNNNEEVTDDGCARMCPMNYAPVCDAEGNRYGNMCEFEVQACLNQALKAMQVAPCDEIQPIDDCPSMCDDIYEPVCDNNGNEYPNQCEFQKSACSVVMGAEPLEMVPCDEFQNTECPSVCDEIYEPVCDSNGVEYPNFCEFQKSSCYEDNAEPLQLAPCAGALECDFMCMENYEPVCDNEGNKYSNLCEFERAICGREDSMSVSLVECDAEPPQDMECNFMCAENYEPVCDSEGNKYSNVCEFERAICGREDSMSISLVECDAETPQDMECDFICMAMYQPVCDSRGHRYANACEFERKKCQVMQSSGVSMEMVECKDEIDRPGCDFPCEDIYSPVCDESGNVYSNFCEFKRAECHAEHKGMKHLQITKCGDVSVNNCEGVVCDLPEGYQSPVCDNHGRVYSDPCSFEMQNCLENSALFISDCPADTEYNGFFVHLKNPFASYLVNYLIFFGILIGLKTLVILAAAAVWHFKSRKSATSYSKLPENQSAEEMVQREMA